MAHLLALGIARPHAVEEVIARWRAQRLEELGRHRRHAPAESELSLLQLRSTLAGWGMQTPSSLTADDTGGRMRRIDEPLGWFPPSFSVLDHRKRQHGTDHRK